MALTGLLFLIFLVIHLTENLFLFRGANYFNQYVETLRNTKLLVIFIEVGVISLLIIHLINGIYLTILNKKTRNKIYLNNSTNNTISSTSRPMILSSVMVFIFLIVHIRTFWYNFQVTQSGFNFFKLVDETKFGFGRPEITFFYIVSMLFLALFIKHGFESALKTFGVLNFTYKSMVGILVLLFWTVIPFGFITIVIYLGFNF